MLRNNFSKKIRVGIDARTLSERGGVKNYVINLVKQIKKDKDIELIIFYNNKKLKGSFKEVKEVCLFPKWKFLLPIYDLIVLPLGAFFYRIDVLHLPKSTSNFFPFIKKVTTLHDLIPITHPETENFLNYLYWKLNFFLSISFSNILITDSKFSKKEILNYYKKKIKRNIEVIHLGIDKNIFKPSTKKEINEIKRKYSLPDRFLLSVGTIQPRKNILRYIEAIGELNINRKIKIPLVLVGRIGWKINFYNNNNNNLIHLDSVSNKDLSKLYSASTIVLFASLIEGFGFPVLEAQSCGTSVITSKNSSMSELTNDSAYLVNPKSTKDILSGIKILLYNKDKRDLFSKKGIINAKKYDWEKSVLKLSKIYKLIANKE